MDAARISFEARRRADSVAPPPRFDPFWASAAEAAIAGSVVAVFCWLGGGSHMAGAIGISMILAFALLYFYLRSQDRKNSEAFDTEYIRLLELERAREKSLAAAKTKSLASGNKSSPDDRKAPRARKKTPPVIATAKQIGDKVRIEEITPKPKRR